MSGQGTSKLNSAHLDLPVPTSSVSDDAFPDFSDPNLFTAIDSPLRLSLERVHNSQTPSDASSLASPIMSPSSSGAGASSSTSTSSSSTGKLLLPVPTPANNVSTPSFALSEMVDEDKDAWFESLPPEVANADISISADGSFVETTSGPAARELKRRYDQQTGLSEDMRSPYVVTAIINQHGKQVYRVGKRSQVQSQDPSPAPELELPSTTGSSIGITSGSGSQTQRKRRSRLSITSVFKTQASRSPEETKQLPSPSIGGPSSNNTIHRKLRKPRSIPDMTSVSGGYFGDEAGSPSPPAPSGRIHSHSVTGADMARPIVTMTTPVEASLTPARPGDTFSNVMGWLGAPASPLTSSGLTPSLRSLNTPSDSPSQSPLDVAGLEQPFGRNASFDSPSPFRNSAVYLPLVLREMQSFESAKTARAITHPDNADDVQAQTEMLAEPTPNSRPDSLDSMASATIQSAESEVTASSPPVHAKCAVVERAVPSENTRLFTQYRTAVFDVIQNYRGLPMLDTLSANSRQPTIKMSLSALDGAIPRDDPRFVIWGEMSVVEDSVELASTHESSSARSRRQSRSFSVSSRKLSLKGKAQASPGTREASPARKSVDGGGSSSHEGGDDTRRVLMAATIERWIAQLTSQFDYDELLIFFLTYRTYIDAFDLCNLFICRFHWALEEPMTQQEVVVKQIVRVRTFVAIRYWLLTFFRFDFLSNRELCLWFANWLNTLWRDPILDKYDDARNIVKKLKKIAKDCKDAHSRFKAPIKTVEKKGKMMQSIDKILGDLSSGVNFAATLRKAAAAQNEEDSDVDLDFNPDESSPFSDTDTGGVQGFAFGNQLGVGEATAISRASVVSGTSSSIPSSPIRPTTSPSRLLLQQPLHLTILQHARAVQPSSTLPLSGSLSTQNGHHNSLSRVVVNTIGRLGRWKRVLSSRTTLSPVSPTEDTTSFDLELNATGDLFAVRGGVEQYLKMIDNAPAAIQSPTTPVSHAPQVTVSSVEDKNADVLDERPASPRSPPSMLDSEASNKTPLASHSELRPASVASSAPEISEESEEILSSETPSELASEGQYENRSPMHKMLSRIRGSDRPDSVRSASSGSLRSFETTTSFFGNPLPRQERTFPDVVSIDDLDDLDYLSDNSASSAGPRAPPGLRPTRRLPNRRDFEFVRRSVDSVSSMGIISRESVAMSEQADSARNSEASPKLGNAVAQWQMNALVDDLSDDGHAPGDVEAALKKLEGQINPNQQKKKEAKVDGWVKTIQERMAAGDFRDDEPRRLSSEEEDVEETVASFKQSGDDASENTTISFPRSSVDSDGRPISIVTNWDILAGQGMTPTPRQTTHPIGNSVSQDRVLSEAKPKIDEAVPEEILLSRLPSRTSDEQPARPLLPQRHGQPSYVSSKLPNTNVYRSFILQYRAEKLVQHFSVIDREIFLGIKFQELVSDEWMQSSEDFNVRDWMQFLRDRRRKAELRGKAKLNVLSAARARFNLVANFVVSEIALTSPHDRIVVVGKFIRIAWKAYTNNNFATLVAIISGLSNDGVHRALKRSWNRVGRWETRVFEDLKVFCSSEDDFGHIRRAIAAIVSAKPLSGQEEASTSRDGLTEGTLSGGKHKTSTDTRNSPPTSCIPFIGIYLSQLYRFSRMPDLIDPSAPHESVEIDPETGNFKACAHPEVFSDLRPLPSSMQIEPLINVQKQRQIAGVVKNLVAGQHLANKLEVEVDKRLLARCLKLSALEPDALQRLLSSSVHEY